MQSLEERIKILEFEVKTKFSTIIKLSYNVKGDTYLFKYIVPVTERILYKYDQNIELSDFDHIQISKNLYNFTKSVNYITNELIKFFNIKIICTDNPTMKNVRHTIYELGYKVNMIFKL